MTEDNQNPGSKLEETVHQIVQCGWCPEGQKRVQITEKIWAQPEFLPRRLSEQYEHAKKNLGISHGICPDCEKMYSYRDPNHQGPGYKGR